MRAAHLALQISLVAGALTGVLTGAAWLARDYTNAKRDVTELVARQAQSKEVSRILGAAMASAQARALSYRAAYEELADVHDDETCRSPAMDRAFDILRRRRSDTGD